MIERDDIKILKNILSIDNKNIDFELLYNVLTVAKDYPELADDLLDSFSNNQFASKGALLKAIDHLKILDSASTVVIWGSWYGSVLIPMLASKVKKVISIDLDDRPLQIAKNQLFKKFKNVDYICDDVFYTHRNQYLETNLIINTSCEHMLPMKDWPWFSVGAIEGDRKHGEGYKTPKLSSNCYFAFQSNNMFGIEGHINCVNSLEEFKNQMPARAKILYEEEVEDTRGTRYMLIGKFMPL